jgi:hypothetical protein
MSPAKCLRATNVTRWQRDLVINDSSFIRRPAELSPGMDTALGAQSQVLGQQAGNVHRAIPALLKRPGTGVCNDVE